MANHIHAQTIPRRALVGAAVLIVGTIALASFAKQPHPENAPESSVAPAMRSSIDVRFSDRADGALLMLDSGSGSELAVLAPASNNFVRGVLRGMFRIRKLESKGHDAPFVLGRETGGRLVIYDPETARRVDLDSFGPTNSSSFEALLAAGETKRAER